MTAYLRPYKLLVVLAAFHASVSYSDTLSPTQIFKRCYSRMVRQVTPETDPLYVQVKNGTKKPEDACVELFDRAQFNASGVMTKRTDPIAKSILRTFHDLHQGWFQSKTNGQLANASPAMRDMEEAPMYYTYVAFTPNVSFKEIILHDGGLQGVRDQASYPNEIDGFRAQRVSLHSQSYALYRNKPNLSLAYTRSDYEDGAFIYRGPAAIDVPSPALVEVGSLVGVKPASTSVTFPSYRPSLEAEPELNAALGQVAVNFQPNAHFGGGIMGSQGFILHNANLVVNVLPETVSLINRRLTARVYEDLLCHRLPTLLEGDVEANPASEFPFQQSKSCMRCHSSIDPMAYGFRNLYLFQSAALPNINTQKVGLPMTGVARLPPDPAARLFALQPPNGEFYYRELITGNPRKGSFSSLAQLGQELAKSPDLYTCAAKRYYKFFTGVDVETAQVAENKLDKYHQDKVIALAKSFQVHQNVRTLLKDIFASAPFKARNYMTEQVGP